MFSIGPLYVIVVAVIVVVVFVVGVFFDVVLFFFYQLVDVLSTVEARTHKIAQRCNISEQFFFQSVDSCTLAGAVLNLTIIISRLRAKQFKKKKE